MKKLFAILVVLSLGMMTIGCTSETKKTTTPKKEGVAAPEKPAPEKPAPEKPAPEKPAEK